MSHHDEHVRNETTLTDSGRIENNEGPLVDDGNDGGDGEIAGAGVGAVGGAVAGTVVAGPIGTVVGGALGAAGGAAAGEAADEEDAYGDERVGDQDRRDPDPII